MPPQSVRRGVHRWRGRRAEPGLLGRSHRDLAPADDFKPGSTSTTTAPATWARRRLLQQFAATHNVKQVVVSIGGNDFNFASIVQSQCVTGLPALAVLGPRLLPRRLVRRRELHLRQRHRSPRQDRHGVPERPHGDAQRRVRATARGTCSSRRTRHRSRPPAGSGTDRPASPGRASAAAASGTRTPTGRTATALATINNTVRAAIGDSGLTNTRLLELQSAFNGRRLCENTVGLYEEVGLSSWTQPTAVDKTEWINQIRTVTTVGSNYFIQESLHPNYWAQLALRSCVRQTYTQNRGGTCTIAGTGLVNGEPRMSLN